MGLFRPKYKDKKIGKQKQSAVWWYAFIYAGERFRQSAKTTKKTVAAEAEKDHRRRLERGIAGMPIEQPVTAIRTVTAVLRNYESQYVVNHRKDSAVIVQNRPKPQVKALGSVLLPDVTPKRIVDYMDQRQGEGASNRTINMELMVLSRAIGYTWKALWPKVKKLEENQDTGRALETDEETRLLSAATEADPSFPDDIARDRNAQRRGTHPAVVTGGLRSRRGHCRQGQNGSRQPARNSNERRFEGGARTARSILRKKARSAPTGLVHLSAIESHAADRRH